MILSSSLILFSLLLSLSIYLCSRFPSSHRRPAALPQFLPSSRSLSCVFPLSFILHKLFSIKMYSQVCTVCVCHSSPPTRHRPPPWSVPSLLRRSYMQTRLRLAAAESRHKLRLRLPTLPRRLLWQLNVFCLGGSRFGECTFTEPTLSRMGFCLRQRRSSSFPSTALCGWMEFSRITFPLLARTGDSSRARLMKADCLIG